MSQRVQSHIFIPKLQVNLVPAHNPYYLTYTLFSRVYPCSAWCLVPACNFTCAWNFSLAIRAHMYHHQAPRTQHGFGRWRRWMEVQIMGLDRRCHFRNRWCCGDVRRTKINAHTPTQNSVWANVLTRFSQVHAGRRPIRERRDAFASFDRSSV